MIKFGIYLREDGTCEVQIVGFGLLDGLFYEWSSPSLDDALASAEAMKMVEVAVNPGSKWWEGEDK